MHFSYTTAVAYKEKERAAAQATAPILYKLVLACLEIKGRLCDLLMLYKNICS